MSEDTTPKMLDNRSFEERVFARFDSLDARMDSLDARMDSLDGRLDSLDDRLQKLESDTERRAIETKPVWERALAEILEVQQGLNEFRREVNDAFRNLSRKIGVLSHDMIQLRADQAHAESRLDNLESTTSHQS